MPEDSWAVWKKNDQWANEVCTTSRSDSLSACGNRPLVIQNPPERQEAAPIPRNNTGKSSNEGREREGQQDGNALWVMPADQWVNDVCTTSRSDSLSARGENLVVTRNPPERQEAAPIPRNNTGKSSNEGREREGQQDGSALRMTLGDSWAE